MKNILDVIKLKENEQRIKEIELARIRREAECLRFVAPLLLEEGEQPEVPAEKPKEKISFP